MKYSIDSKGQIALENKKYWILSGELNNFSRDDLEDIIQDFENVFQGKYEESSFSQNVAIVSFTKENTTIEDYDGVLGQESSLEIYNMLKIFLDAKFK